MTPRVAAIAACVVCLTFGSNPAPVRATQAPTIQAPAPVPAVTASIAALPAIPAKWPSQKLEVGLTDSPNGASSLHATVPSLKFRYQYLSGGVNTGSGWATWNAGAKFADYYVDESVAAGMTPVFIYYQLLQSAPNNSNGSLDEKGKDLANARNNSTMNSYWADVRLLFQHLGAYSQTMVLDIEPDLWGYFEQASTDAGHSDDATAVPVSVASSGDADTAAYPNNVAGFAQAFVHLRNKYAPNVLLSYELSDWGTYNDPVAQNLSLAAIDTLAARSVAFEQSTGAAFDLVSTDPTDRDAGFYAAQYGSNTWWDSADYDRFNEWNGVFVRGVGLRMMLWQTPVGNTKMRAMNNSWGHYQDNHVEWWFGDGVAANQTALLNSGVIAVLYGGGAGGCTAAADEMGDGVTNPAAINGNTTTSYSADDDGGYFKHQVNAYYSAGAVPLPGGSAPPPSSAPGTYVPVSPTRLVDTRDAATPSHMTRLVSHQPQSWTVAGVGPIPAGAIAVTGNVTVTGSTAGGYVTLGPSVASSPGFSTINFPAGDDRANGVTVTLSSDGKLAAVFVSGSSTTAYTHFVFDVTGYFVAGSASAGFHALTTYRALDTRLTSGTLTGAFVAGTPRQFSVGSSVPSDAVAVTGNLTVTGQTAKGWFALGPTVTSNPGFSTINFPVGDNRANNVTVQLGAGGTLQADYGATAGAQAQLIFDVTGYYGPGGASYVPISPVRDVDTRIGLGGASGGSSVLVSGSVQSFTLASFVPAGAVAVTGNVTVTSSTSEGYVTVAQALTFPPPTSTINFPRAEDRANGVVMSISSPSFQAVYAGTAGATTHFIFDLTGYFVAPG